MKTVLKKLIYVVFAGLTIFLISWDYLKPQTDSPDNVDDYQLYWDDGFSPVSDAATGRRIPAAEDVLVKRIPGDNMHLLILAYYSKARYSGPSFTLDAGNAILNFTDDGKGFDEKAGDGLYTARMPVNLKEFKAEAISIAKEMKRSKEKVFRFENRTLINNRNFVDFDPDKLDRQQALSIADLNVPMASTLIDTLMKNSILITDLKVVEDPTRTWNPCTQTGNLDGSWSFKTLFQQIASPSPDQIADDQQLSDFVKRWLNLFTKNRIINSDSVAGRPKMNDLLLNPWLQKSRDAGNPAGFLDMRFAPFKLTAIVNRFDLRTRFSQIQAGEARFIFTAIDNNCSAPLPFTFIIEYGIPKKGDCDTLKDWAGQWFSLKFLERGSETYNQALQDITDQFTLCGKSENKPNQSCFNNLRTNDRAFSPDPVISEFREFHLNGKSHQLVPATVAQVPADRYNAQQDNPDVQLLAKYINDRSDSIKVDLYSIPNEFEGQPFLAGVAHILGNPLGDPRKSPVYHWDGSLDKNSLSFIQNPTTRHVFSLNTCTGCHSGEFQTNFFHVEPAFFGTEARMSGFLTGRPQPGAFDADLDPNNENMMVVDAALRPTKKPSIRKFNDILRRAKDLKRLATRDCGSVFQVRDQLMFQPVNAPD